MDYVGHDDIIPYATRDKAPIQHELFNRLFAPNPNVSEEDFVSFEPQSSLLKWQQNYHQFMELSDVYKQTSNNISVTVMPFYMGLRESDGKKHCVSIFKIVLDQN